MTDQPNPRKLTADDFYQAGLDVRKSAYVMGAGVEWSMLWKSLSLAAQRHVDYHTAHEAFMRGYEEGKGPPRRTPVQDDVIYPD